MELPARPEDIPAAFAAAWEARDAAALAALFAEDADFVNVVGLWWRNRGDIERAHHYGLTTFLRASELSARRIEVKRLGETLATVHVRWRLRGQLDKQGNRLNDRFAIMLFVAEKKDSGWQVVAAQNTDIVSGAETFAASGEGLRPTDYRD